MRLLETARQMQADMVLTHHPLFISPVKTVDFSTMPGCAIALAAQAQIAVVCAHTNLDKAVNGLNDELAGRLQILVDQVLEMKNQDPEACGAGLGRVGPVPAPVTLSRMADQVKSRLGVAPIRVVGDPDQVIQKAAVCSGSGGGLVPAFLASGADVFVTGDIKYHEARLIQAHGRALIDVGHFASEIIATDLLVRRLDQAVSRAGYSLEIQAFAGETDPFFSV
jgi:dinuclear metal center YbgI/SA1388 family protein